MELELRWQDRPWMTSLTNNWFIEFFYFEHCGRYRINLIEIVPFNSVAQLCLILCDPMDCSTPGSLSITNSRSLLRLMFIESLMSSSHLILCHPLLLLPLIFPTIRVFSNESVLHIRWPKYWSFSCSISPSNDHPGLISLRMDWLDLLAVQGTLKSLLQHHSSKAFFSAQLSL